MLAQAAVDTVVAGLASGLSQRKVARLAGVSRGTVNAISTGKRGPWGREPEEDEPPSIGPLKRCGECGHLVSTPCVYCEAIAYLEGKRGDLCLAD